MQDYPFVAMVALYSVYGLALFVMGFVCLGLATGQARDRLARNLLFMALFGLTHGLLEWMETFGIVLGKTGYTWAGPVLGALRLALLPVSVMFLMVFGIRCLTDSSERWRRLWGVAALLLCVWAIAGALPLIASGVVAGKRVDIPFMEHWQGALSRYLLYLPASLLAAFGLLSYRRQFLDQGMKRIAGYTTMAAAALGINALAGGIMVPNAPFPPARWLNYDTFSGGTAIPPQAVQAVVAIVVAFAILQVLRYSEEAQRQRVEAAHAHALELEERARRQAEEWGRTLEASVKERTAQIEALAAINAEISSQLDLDRLLDMVIGKTQDLLLVDVVILSLLEGNELRVRATAGGHTSALNTIVMPLGHGVSGKAAATGSPVAVEDYLADTAITHELDHLMVEEGLKSHMAVPLKMGDRVLGALYVASRSSRHFSDREVALASRLGQQAAIALENARLYQQVQDMAAVTERERLSRELHDSLAQAVGLLRMQASQAADLLRAGQPREAEKALDDLDRSAEAAYSDVREAILGLRSKVLPERGLVPLLRDYLQTFSVQNGIKAELKVEPGREYTLPPKVEIQLVRIVQEALTNVRKHARASKVTVEFQRQDGAVQIAVQDNGVGFDPEAARGREMHFGLTTMRERAEAVGGKLTVYSAPGQGTRVVLRIPLASTTEVVGNEN